MGWFSQLFKRNTDNHKQYYDNNSDYNNITLPNGNTIAQQKKIDLDIAMGKYPAGTHNYLGMKIVSSTVPPNENYYILNENEKRFFLSFYNCLIESKLSPSEIKLTRMSNGEFNVDYVSICYVGKINLSSSPITFAVIKKGNNRATRVFQSLEEANSFINSRSEYLIQQRCEKHPTFMQYLRGSNTVKNLYGLTVEQCIELIPYWVRYIKYCKRN